MVAAAVDKHADGHCDHKGKEGEDCVFTHKRSQSHDEGGECSGYFALDSRVVWSLSLLDELHDSLDALLLIYT